MKTWRTVWPIMVLFIAFLLVFDTAPDTWARGGGHSGGGGGGQQIRSGGGGHGGGGGGGRPAMQAPRGGGGGQQGINRSGQRGLGGQRSLQGSQRGAQGAGKNFQDQKRGAQGLRGSHANPKGPGMGQDKSRGATGTRKVGSAGNTRGKGGEPRGADRIGVNKRAGDSRGNSARANKGGNVARNGRGERHVGKGGHGHKFDNRHHGRFGPHGYRWHRSWSYSHYCFYWENYCGAYYTPVWFGVYGYTFYPNGWYTFWDPAVAVWVWAPPEPEVYAGEYEE